MAAATYTIQKLLDGYRNVVYRVVGEVTDTDVPQTTLIQLSALSPVPTSLRIDRVKYSLPNASNLDVQLWWDATSPELIWGVSGGDDGEFNNFGGITNNAPPGFTGNILFSTSGAVSASTQVLTFAVIVECVKQRVNFEV
jgi:hypothetical protein